MGSDPPSVSGGPIIESKRVKADVIVVAASPRAQGGNSPPGARPSERPDGGRSGAVDEGGRGTTDVLRELEREISALEAEVQRLERRLVEVERSRDRFRDMIHSADGVVVAHRSGRILFANPAAARLLGQPGADLEGERLRFPLVPGESREIYLGSADPAGDGQGGPEDAERVLEIRTVPSGWDPDQVFVVWFRDVTARRQAEARLRRSEEQLRQAQKMEAIGRLAGGVAHDFNNLLTAITGFAELLSARIPEEDGRRTFVDEILKASARGARLTSQLLAFSRRQVLRPEVVDVREVVTGLEGMFRQLLGERIQFDTRCDSRDCHVMADRGQLEQVLINLALNARDAMPDGGRLTIRCGPVRVESSSPARDTGEVPAGDYVTISVRDTGCGMDERTLRHIFEPFFTTKEEGKGTGLGLSTVYGIVKQSNGYIVVHSEPGAGAEFAVYLPHLQDVRTDERPDPGPSQVGLATETILVAEDAPDVRALVCEVLESAGYSVLEARDGAEALDICREYDGRIDGLVTDVVMPGLNGRELARMVGELRPEVRVLYISGYPGHTESDVDQLAGRDDFLGKPFKGEALVRKLRAVLDRPSGDRSRPRGSRRNRFSLRRERTE